jgi:predicted phage terminase large subunit-like protein
MDQPKPEKGNVYPTVLKSVADGLLCSYVSFHDFVVQAWPIIEPGRVFIDGVHVKAICEHLEMVTYGKITRLIINVCPRYGKSNLVTVLWPVWEWTMFPSRRWMFCSYSASLSVQHSIKRRRIIGSKWYQDRWGNMVKLEKDQNRQDEFENTRRGIMVATSTGGTTTGKGGDCLVGDDVLNPQLAESKTERESTHDFIDHVWTSRLDDKKHGRMVWVEQRLHCDDVTGHVSKSGDYTILTLPAEFTKRTEIKLPMSGEVVVKEPGDLLNPEREGHPELAVVKRAMGTRAYNAQYLQQPSEVQGKMIKRNWWVPLKECPIPLFILNVWDTAVKEKQQNDFSVGLCIVKHAKGYHFKAMTRGQMRFSSLKIAVKNRFDIDHANAVLVEDKSSGQQVTQELQDETAIPVINPSPDFQKMDKVSRCNMVQPLWEAGRISYDPDMEGAADMIEEFASFPGGAHDDIVDSGVHGVYYLSKMDANEEAQEDMEVDEGPIDEGL